MRAPRSIRARGWSVRLAAASLAVLHLVLAIGASRHTEEHRLEAAARLPQVLHHHDFSLAGVAAGVRPAALERCIACQLSRLVPRLVPMRVVPSQTPELVATLEKAPSPIPSRVEHSARITRSPPAAV